MEKAKIIERLRSFGYEYDESSDSFSLEFAIERVTNHILNEINCEEIPDRLIPIAIDMVCGEFLKVQKAFGKLNNITFEQIANNIRLGDANVQFATESTPEQKFDAAVDNLLSGYESDFACFRKLVW